jgi:hypothetical protein
MRRLADRFNAMMVVPSVVDAMSKSGLNPTPGTAPGKSRAYAVAEHGKR